jgi:hypothetical protein
VSQVSADPVFGPEVHVGVAHGRGRPGRVGGGLVDEAVAKARKERIPRESDPVLWCLERLLESCQRLAERIGRSDFPLPVSTVARILDVDNYEAWRLVHAFVLDGVLVKVSTGRVGQGGGAVWCGS